MRHAEMSILFFSSEQRSLESWFRSRSHESTQQQVLQRDAAAQPNIFTGQVCLDKRRTRVDVDLAPAFANATARQAANDHKFVWINVGLACTSICRSIEPPGLTEGCGGFGGM